MLIAQFNRPSHFVHNHLPLTGRDENEHTPSSLAVLCHHLQPMPTKRNNSIRATSTSITKATISNPFYTKSSTVKGVITVQPTLFPALHNSISGIVADGISDLFGWSFLLELVSKEHNYLQAYASFDLLDSFRGVYVYNCKFEVPHDFGEIVAVTVENEYHHKMFFNKIELENIGVTFTCDCWVHSKHDNPDKRTFFSDQCIYLPTETPNALIQSRAKDLVSLQGKGKEKEERLHFERIYDYDVYNDLGNPDENFKLARPALGGEKFPYPRRCRTGRKMSCKDPSAETRSSEPFYVPLDEDFSEIKDITFTAKAVYSVLHGAIPFLNSRWTDRDKGFPLFTSIDLLYNEGVNVPAPPQGLQNILPRLFKRTADKANTLIKFEVPETLNRDSFSWLSDEEFCRQMLAGLNPCSIKLVTEWPLVSKLDPGEFGQAESAITKEIVETQIRGFMTLEEALTQKKLFMLDYHDLLLPYVNITRELEGTTLYGSRTLMFLTPDETLRPIAIELTRPPYYEKPQWKHVYTPMATSDSTGAWLWKLAKAHVLAHDSGHHQLISHWLRTHCVTEPYVIATHRQLSQMHPIYRLLIPHFRYTLQLNAIARHSLINAGGTIESTFSPGKYSMQLSSHAYDQLWRFDQEALPADLISRGMAIEDQNEPHGLKLTINDYPYANDGLLLWDAIEHWATSYVNHYYPQAILVESDKELQQWWYEIRTVGHGDKKNGWPQLETQDDLIKIVSTIMWVAAGLHSAVNFGQYDFAGYFPNRPSIARTKMPNEDPTDKEWEEFMKRPEEALLKCFPSQIQAITVMAVLDVLSSHSPDENYIGKNIEKGWEAEPAIKVAFEEFQRRLNKLDGIIDSKNADPHWKNRHGAGMVPYQFFKPYSECGVTGKGVPNSISI